MATDPTFGDLFKQALVLDADVSGAVDASMADAQTGIFPIGDACGMVGEIVGLDPQGDGFLSVRSGPGGKPFREIDRVHNGDIVSLREERGPWKGVVYAPRGQSGEADCGVSTPHPRRAPYAGPCNAGWIHGRYVRLVAG